MHERDPLKDVQQQLARRRTERARKVNRVFYAAWAVAAICGIVAVIVDVYWLVIPAIAIWALAPAIGRSIQDLETGG